MAGSEQPHPPSTTDGTASLSVQPGTLAAMRDEARARLADYPEATVIDALLVADVLITDALGAGQAIQQLTFDDQSPHLRIEVTSAPTAEQPERSSPEQGVARLMLEELTHSWGVERGQRRRTAWAELVVTH